MRFIVDEHGVDGVSFEIHIYRSSLTEHGHQLCHGRTPWDNHFEGIELLGRQDYGHHFSLSFFVVLLLAPKEVELLLSGNDWLARQIRYRLFRLLLGELIMVQIHGVAVRDHVPKVV